MIADEDTIRDWVDNARDEAASAHYRYSKYIPEYEDSPPEEDY
jgi:hypothetical protein